VLPSRTLPGSFVWRRLQSLAGIWLVLFLMQHLLINSLAALPIGSDGGGFIRWANQLYNMPYLEVVEVALLGVPFLIHGVWGVIYLFQAKFVGGKSDGTEPTVGRFGRNRAFRWQRITSWILLVGLVGHVVQMRFMDRPERVGEGYQVEVRQDPGLESVARRLGVQLQDGVALCPDFGTAELLMVRQTFQNPWYMLGYTAFVLAAVFHAFNGLWTFLIKWGVLVTVSLFRRMAQVATGLSIVFGLLGLSSIWLTYWVNLRS
jgi:succinate dehydrogenase / fumarate reductase, cytochrome b subunit